LDGVNDLEGWVAAEETQPGAERGTVTQRFFDETGAPRELADVESPAAFEQIVNDELEAFEAAGSTPDATLMEYYAQHPDADHLDAVVQGEAAMHSNARAYESALRDKIAAVGRQAGVRDEDAIDRTAWAIQGAQRDWFAEQMAQGATIQQALAAMRAPEFHQWQAEQVAGLLEAEKYMAVTANTKMAKDRQRWERDDAQAVALGLEPSPDVFELSSMQKFARTLRAHADRVERSKEAQRDWMRRANQTDEWRRRGWL
jgi:hypothetical protein